MITGFRHAGIVVEDLDRSLAFYVDKLGFKVVNQQDECGPYIDYLLQIASAQVTTVKLAAPDGSMIELLKFSRPMGPIRKHEIFEHCVSHLAFTVDDVQGMYEKLFEEGVGFKAPPLVSPDGKCKLTFALDPDGTYLELVQALN